MSKETKLLVGGLVLIFMLMAGFAYFVAINNQPLSAALLENMEVQPSNYELGEVKREGGMVTRQYQIKNTSDRDIKLEKITTSCMCTLASLKVGDEQTNYYGMEHGGNRNPRISFILPAGQTGVVSVDFDPNAHGPQGVGAFDRVVWLHFTQGIQQLSFNGTVVD